MPGAIIQIQSFFLCVIQVITLCFSRPSFLLVCFIYFMFPRRFPYREESLFFWLELLSPKICREKQVPTYVGEIHENSSTGGALPPADFIYIYIWRHEISCYRVPISPSPAPRRLTRPARALGDWRLIRLAAVSTKMGRNTPLLCVVMVNTTLSGGGQPPPPRKPAGLVDYVACDRFPLLAR